MVQTLMDVLKSAFALLEIHERDKYHSDLLDLERQYHEETNKDPSVRSDAVLDELESQLRILADSFTALASKPNAPNQP